MPDSSIDLLATDPPYGIGFMGKDWDKALPGKVIWQECLRILKPGAFAFIMSIPRADCLSRMIISLEDAGFMVGFTPIFWAYASGFPKAQNISKVVDKRLGAEREVIGKTNTIVSLSQAKGYLNTNTFRQPNWQKANLLTVPSSPQAKALDGSYGGFQPKLAVEVIIVAMKPLSEKTFVDQALKNRKGVTWLDEGRIPYKSEEDEEASIPGRVTGGLQHFGNRNIQPDLSGKFPKHNNQGRFPANLIVSDDVLNDGRIRKSGFTKIGTGKGKLGKNPFAESRGGKVVSNYPGEGSFSRYFDLDSWFEEKIKQLPASVQKTFPFLIVPKASKSEKNRGCEGFYSLKDDVPLEDIVEIQRLLSV